MPRCQSCGMEMRAPGDRGTERDGAPSERYCRHCYEAGAFRDADVTLDEMIGRATGLGIARDNLSAVEARARARAQVPELARWRERVAGATRSWWTLLLRGLLGILFGVLVLARPGASLLGVVLVFGIFAFADGVVSFVDAFRPGEPARWLDLLLGVSGIAAGVITFVNPSLTAVALYILFAAWTVVTGALRIGIAAGDRAHAPHRGANVFVGILSIIVGVLLIALPQAGVLALVWLLALWGFVFGGAMISLAFRVRHLHRSLVETRPPSPLGPPTIQPA